MSAGFTSHVTGHARHWSPVVRHNGKTVWTGESRSNRDNDITYSLSARSISRMVVTALNDPEGATKRIGWLTRYGRNRSDLEVALWATKVADSIRSAISAAEGGASC